MDWSALSIIVTSTQIGGVYANSLKNRPSAISSYAEPLSTVTSDSGMVSRPWMYLAILFSQCEHFCMCPPYMTYLGRSQDLAGRSSLQPRPAAGCKDTIEHSVTAYPTVEDRHTAFTSITVAGGCHSGVRVPRKLVYMWFSKGFCSVWHLIYWGSWATCRATQEHTMHVTSTGVCSTNQIRLSVLPHTLMLVFVRSSVS
jgi:hypothetical protein